MPAPGVPSKPSRWTQWRLLPILLVGLTNANHYNNTSARFLQDGTEYVRVVVGLNPSRRDHDSTIHHIGLRAGSLNWDNGTAVTKTGNTAASFREYFAGRRVYEFKRSPAIAVTVPVSEIDSILALPEVEYVEEDALVRGFQVDYDERETTPWGIGAVQGQYDKQIQLPTGKGKGNERDPNCFAVCVVDSGILPHEDLPFEMGDGNFFGESFGIDDEWNKSEDDHGIHITGIIMAKANNGIGVRGIVPDAKSSNYCLMVARVFGSVRSTSTSIIDEAVEWCVDNGAKVINLSLGTSYRSRSSEMLVEKIVKEEDVILVAAAGNAPDLRSLRSLFYPASFPGVISVASVDSDLSVSSFSQRNSEVDVSAPGRDVLSLAANPEILLFDPQGSIIESRLMVSSIRPGATITAQTRDCDYGLEPCTKAKDRICIMSRGENTFSEKVRNCYLGGGLAMVLYNNEPGVIAGSLGPDPPNIPALCVPQDKADRLLGSSKLTIKQGIGSYATLTGTSMATPYVTGAIAKIWAARPGCKKDQVIAAILETATDLGESGRDEDYGAGLVQVVKAYDYLMALPSPCGKGGGSSSAAGVRPSEEGEKDGKITASQMDEENRNRFPTAQPVTIGPPVPSSSENVWDRLKARIRGSK